MKQTLIATLVFIMMYCIPIYCHADVLLHRGRPMEDAQHYLKRLHTLCVIPQEYFRVKPVMDMFYVVYDGPTSFEQLHEIYPWVEPIHSNNKSVTQNHSQAILPETMSRVVMSNSQINRIVAPKNRKVKDIIFSPGKGISAQIKGRNIFVSFDIMPDPATGKHLYRTGEAELYVVLEQDLIYPLVIVPENTHARTVTLSFGADRIKKSII